MDHPLSPLVKQWLAKIQIALDWKAEEFGRDAEEAMRFFDGPYDFMYGVNHAGRGSFAYLGNHENFPKPSFGMTVNKVAEMVQLFGPALYHRNPVRQVNPRKVPTLPPEVLAALAPSLTGMDALMQQQGMGGPPGMAGMGMGGAAGMDPMALEAVQAQAMQMLQMQVMEQQSTDQARASILEHYLNWTPEALDLKTESRWAIDEALIKGMGLLWTEVYTPPIPGAQKMVGSFWGTVDDLVIDSDVTLLREARWIARRCVHPVWEVEREYGLPPGTLKGQLESHHQQAGVAAIPEMAYRRQQGRTNDLLVYWKIWSKMGLGGRLHGAPESMKELTEPFGDYAYFVVAPGVEYPLNLPAEMLAQGDMQKIMSSTQWPTPYWADDGWPFVPIIFHDRPNHVWPMSHLKPGMGELKFINWMYSFVAGKIKTACRDFLAMRKSLGEEIKTAILSGSDYELLELEEQHGTISEVVGFLQHPEFHGDIWNVLQAVEANFEKRTGLTELMYGMSARQYRSAEEAATKRDAISIRPDDMAQKVEESMTLTARREALTARWHLQGQDVAAVLGPLGAQVWDRLITVTDPGAILYQLEYRIEAGSARKPNKDNKIQQMNQAMQTLFQSLWGLAMQTGNVQPVNALLEDWAKANDLDVAKYLIPPPPMPAMPPEGGVPPEGAPPEGPPAQE